MERIGVMGGTFNPVHLSHIMVASRAYDMLNLDKVLFMPSKQPTYKKMDCIASEEDRCAMIERAIKPYPFFELSDFELRREGPTYSSDTFSLLKKENPDTKYYFIIGGDSLDYFEDWHLPDIILQNCTLVVAPRATELKERVSAEEFTECDYAVTADRIRKKFTCELNGQVFTPEIVFLSSPLVSISSSDIRNYLECGISVNGLLAKDVIDYIKEKGLYENKTFVKIRDDMKALMKPKRYTHIMNVASMCFKLAKLHGYDPVKAYTAGLLHDCAKHLNDEEILNECDKLGIRYDEVERRQASNLLHSKVGAVWAKEKYGIADEDIISAINYHTTGKPEMSILEKIVYMSDVIEPGRQIDYKPSLDVIRSIATYDLDLACAHVLNNVVPYILSAYKDNVCMTTVETYEYYKKFLNK
ncbi:MAG: nicotinate-nucleotide adenylyltransferase [Lachnospiraceae bacterium]|nr:nicotinate-nucleotide adenylyltransferase [Lachnospiraceae bacterium]